MRRGDEFHFFHEAIYRDTQQIAQGLQGAVSASLQDSGSAGTHSGCGVVSSVRTAAAQESDLGILEEGWSQGEARSRATRWCKIRINAVNVLVESSERCKVGNGCKNLIRTFEQHAYDDKGKPEKGGVGMDDLSHCW